MQPKIADEISDLEILLLSRIYGVSFYVASRSWEELGRGPSLNFVHQALDKATPVSAISIATRGSIFSAAFGFGAALLAR
jgi:hypothetical protein